MLTNDQIRDLPKTGKAYKTSDARGFTSMSATPGPSPSGGNIAITAESAS
jgi:hypothetical protein